MPRRQTISRRQFGRRQTADLIVVDNGDDGNTCAHLFVDQIDHDGAVSGIEGRIRSSNALHEAVAAARCGSILPRWPPFRAMRSIMQLRRAPTLIASAP